MKNLATKSQSYRMDKTIELEIFGKTFVASSRENEKSEFSLAAKNGKFYYQSKNDIAEFLLDDLTDRIAFDKNSIVLYLLRNKVVLAFANLKIGKEAECIELGLSDNEIEKTITLIKWYSRIATRKQEIFIVPLQNNKLEGILLMLNGIPIEIVEEERLESLVKASIKSFNLFQKSIRYGVLFGLLLLAFFSGKIVDSYANDFKEELTSRKYIAEKNQRELKLSHDALKAENMQLRNKPYRIYTQSDMSQHIIKDFIKHPKNNFIVENGVYKSIDILPNEGNVSK